MKASNWHIFFDLHEVLVDIKKVPKCYEEYLASIFSKYDYSIEKIKNIHKEAFQNWIVKFRKLTSFYEISNDSDLFMKKLKEADEKWENTILKYASKEDKDRFQKVLSADHLEYKAMLNCSWPIIFPDTIPVLKRLKSKNFNLHLASSASSSHIQGFVDRYNLNKVIDHIIGVDTVKAPKKGKSELYFNKMFEITNSDPKYSIFLGDSEEEVYHALNFDMFFIMVDRYGKHSDLEDSDFPIVSDLEDVPKLVDEITG